MSRRVQTIPVVGTASSSEEPPLYPMVSVPLLGIGTCNPTEPQVAALKAQMPQVGYWVWCYEGTLAFLFVLGLLYSSYWRHRSSSTYTASWRSRCQIFSVGLPSWVPSLFRSLVLSLYYRSINLALLPTQRKKKRSSVYSSWAGTLAELLTDHSTILLLGCFWVINSFVRKAWMILKIHSFSQQQNENTKQGVSIIS